MRQRLCGILALLLLIEWTIPLIAEQGPDFRELYKQYEKRYFDYFQSVTSGAPGEEVQRNFKAYISAQEAYKEAINPARDPVFDETKVNFDRSSGIENNLSPASPDISVSSQPQALTPTSSKGFSSASKWFGKTFLKFKKLFNGPQGAKVMPLWEKIAWNIGKALVPAFGVMIATALLAPFSPIAMIVGGIAAGAVLGGSMTYAFEKRMNRKFRDVPKEDAKIWRDVSVQASVEAIMAPFNLATGGLFGMVGPTVGNAIGRVALTQAVLGFSGSVISSRAGGMVKHLWSKYYFHYPEKIASSERRIDELLKAHVDGGFPFSESEVKELDRLRAEINSMKTEDYSDEDFQKDLKRAALSATISGFLGSVVSDRFYTYETGRWADRISVHMFGSVAQGKQISGLISTIPVNYLSGIGGAALEKHFVSNDIVEIKKEQKTYPPGGPAYLYFDHLIKQMEDTRDGIKLYEAGLNSLVNNLAVRSAQLSVQFLKYQIYDGPISRKRSIDDLYRRQDPDWQKAEALYQEYRKTLAKIPDPRSYRSPVKYARDQAAYLRNVEVARREWLSQSILAQNSEKLPDRQALRDTLATKFDRETRLNQMLELGRLNGGMAHVEAMKSVLKEKDPTLARLPELELTQLACQAIAKSYQDKFSAADSRIQGIDETIKKFDDYKAGKIKLPEGEAKILEGKRSLISPSQYKAAFVERQVFQMKANNVRWGEVERKMPSILQEAEKATLEKYGGNWMGLLSAELYANGLARYKYNPETGTDLKTNMKDLFKRIPTMIESGLVGDYRTRVNNAIVGSVLPKAGSAEQSAFENYMQTFAKTAVTEGSGRVFDSVYSSTRGVLLSSFSR